MRTFLFSFIAMLATALSGCDSGVSASPDGGGECSPASASAGQCPATLQCVTLTTSCPCDPFASADAGVTCFAIDSSDAGTLSGGYLSAPPAQGTCCDVPDMICGGWDVCAPICRCEYGAWSCKEPDCPLFFCPDSASKLAGKNCDDRIGTSCTSSPGGCFEVCSCTLRSDVSGGVWECSGGICEPMSADAGPPPPDAGPDPADGGMP